MGVKGHQHFWVAGARLYLQQDAAVGANPSPILDLGVVQEANPTIVPESRELFDSDSGVRNLVDTEIAQIDESYSVRLSNMNVQNLQFLFLADSTETYLRSQNTLGLGQTYVNDGHLAKVVDINGDWAYNLMCVSGVYSTTGTIGTEQPNDMDATAGTVTFAADVSSTLTTGTYFGITGFNVGTANSTIEHLRAVGGMWKVLSVSTVTVTVDTAFRSITVDEPFTAGVGVALRAGSTTFHAPGSAWEVASLDRGLVRSIPSGSIGSATVNVAFTQHTVAGARAVTPQSALGVVKGKMMLVYSMDNFGAMYVREADVSITPSGANIAAGDFSDMTLEVRIINDLTSSTPAGTLIYAKGELPTLSAVQASQGD